MSDRVLVYGLLADLTEAADVEVAQELARLLWRAANEVAPVSDAEATAVANAARVLLSLGTDDRAAVRALISAARVLPSALGVLEETLTSRPTLRLLEAIGAELKDLAPLAVRLTALCGIATFRHLGDLDEDDQSNRRGRTILAGCRETYVRMLGPLLTNEPVLGVELAVEIINQGVRAELRDHPEPRSPCEFHFLGGLAALLPDRSLWWGQYRAEHARRASNALARAAIEDDRVAKLCLRELPALFWSELLERSSEHPEKTATRFAGLLAVPSLLRCSDTNAEAAAFLESARPFLSDAALEEITKAIAEVDVDDVAWEFARLLPDAMRNQRMRTLCATPEEARIPLRDRRPRVSSGVGTVDDDFWVRRQGIDPSKPENRELLALLPAIEEFERKFANAPPPREVVVALLPQIHALHAALSAASGEAYVLMKATDVLAAAVETVLRSEHQPIDEIRALRPIVFLAARHPDPPAGERGYSASGWGRPAPRIEGASAVMMLAKTSGIDEGIADLIDALSCDPVEAVRYQVYVRANLLFDVDRSRMWRLLDRWVETEQGALAYLVGPVSAIFRSEPQRTSELLVKLWARNDLQKAEDIRADLAPVVGYLAEMARIPSARGLLDGMLADAVRHTASLRRILADHRGAQLWLDDKIERRTIALAFLRRVLASALALKGRADDSAAQEAAVELAEEIVTQIVFSLEDPHGNQRVVSTVAGRLFDEADDLLQGAATFAMADFRAHMMTKLLGMWLRARPERGVVAAASYVESSAALRAWWNARDLIEALGSIDEASVRSPEARTAFVKAAGRLARFAGKDEAKLMAMMSRLSRAP